jgi:di/tripeptidase
MKTIAQIEKDFDEKFTTEYNGKNILYYDFDKDESLIEPKEIKSFIRSEIKQILEEIETELDRMRKETGFNAQYNDQYYEAKGYHQALKEIKEYISKILNK